VSISEIHHVALAVSDMERSIAFYRDILGFAKPGYAGSTVPALYD